MDQVWFVLGCVSPRHELKVRDDARRYGLESFVPLKYDVKKRQGHDRRVLVPALSRYIFVKGTLEAVQDYIAQAHFVVYIQRSTFSGHKDYLTVPAKAMDDFIAVTENNEQRVTYFSPQEIRLNIGDQIRVKGGLYDGREGIIMRIKGKRNKHLVVQIPGILIAAVEMSPDMIELTNADNVDMGSSADAKSKSKNVDSDKKLLFDLAHRLLFEFSDKYKNENEYYLLLSELRRTRARLLPFKGYTPAAEAELALPLFMAEALGEMQGAEGRLRKAIEALKDSSLLKVRCQMYLAVLTHDTALLDQIQALFAEWRKSPLSSKQRCILEEFALFSNKN